MILFAIGIDIIIRKLQDIVSREEDQGLGAFADDIGMVIRNNCDTLPEVFHLFSLFARMSGLHLNIERCVVIAPADNDKKIEGFTSNFKKTVLECSRIAIKIMASILAFSLAPDPPILNSTMQSKNKYGSTLEKP